MSDLQDLPLPALFNRAEATLHKLQSTPSPSQTQLINDVLTCLDRASVLVDSLGLFSSNEDKDDLTTGVIQYLLIPYYKAEILAEQHQNYTHRNDSNGDTDSALLNQQKLRLESLKSAQTLHEYFLLQAQQYDVLSAGALKCIFGVVESTNFSSVAAQPPKIDAATLRELKIEKFKLEKSVAARVNALSNRLSASEKTRNEDENEDADDEAAERELQILRIEASALKSIESLRSIRQEIEVLRHATNLTDEDRRKKSTLSSSSQDPQQQQTQEMLAELRKAAGALKLGQEAVHRDSLRQAVFQPTVQLPTLTVEQQGDIEVAQILAQQRIEAEKAQKIAAARAERGRKADDSEEDDEFEGKVYKQRAMDDWKDENPRGWGNSKLKPCG